MGKKVSRKIEKTTDNSGQAFSGQKELFPVIALGASAGGLEALEQFFKNLPYPTGAAFVIISHLAPTHSSIMSEIISRFTRLKVEEASEGIEVRPDHVYVIPPNRDLAIFHGHLQLTHIERTTGARTPIDYFVRSLAEDMGDKAIMVILSGTGSDGTLGLRSVQGAGGVVFVQDPADAKYDGMPQSAIHTGLADYVLPAHEIPHKLMDFLARYGSKQEMLEEKGIPEMILKILRVIRSKTGHDFSHYKKKTIIRRVQRRISVHNLEPAEYLRYIQEHADEARHLFKELLINVTSFFREPEAFAVLKTTILPELLNDKQNYTLRVWVPGCATGEEAYSIAMVIREYAEDTGHDYKAQIFATDIDDDSVAQARTGIYPPNITLDVSHDRLAKFFVKEDAGYRVKKDIREMIIFANQNAIKDAPFTRLDIVSCRNLLIYLETDLQARLISLFHYALNENGILFLGSSETIGSLTDLFGTADRKWKFFRAKPTIGHGAHPQGYVPYGWPAVPRNESTDAITAKGTKLEDMVQKELLSAFAPPAIVVNEQGDILYISGDTAKYLTPASGRPTLNIAKMMREALRYQIRSALMAAKQHMQKAIYRGINIRTNGDTETIDLVVKPLPASKGEEPLFMFMFQKPVEEKKVEAIKGNAPDENEEGSRVAELEKELAYVREKLNAAAEEAQANDEELRSANEEMQSANEELQSTNEEMETSKEEMQSVNEELVTVNAELQSKIEQLSRMENDMKNLLDSTEIATIFLDRDLIIKGFTASTKQIMNLISTDVGRPIDHITPKIEFGHISEKVREVIDRLQPFETEVKAKNGQSFLMRILPYKTIDNVIDGAVVTFTDVTQSKRIAKERAEFAENIVQTVREPLLVLDDKLRVVMANEAFYSLFHVDRVSTEGQSLQDLGGRQWDIDPLFRLLLDVVGADKVFQDFRVEAKFPTIGSRIILLNARKIKSTSDGTVPFILLAMEDITGNERSAGETNKKKSTVTKVNNRTRNAK